MNVFRLLSIFLVCATSYIVSPQGGHAQASSLCDTLLRGLDTCARLINKLDIELVEREGSYRVIIGPYNSNADDTNTATLGVCTPGTRAKTIVPAEDITKIIRHLDLANRSRFIELTFCSLRITNGLTLRDLDPYAQLIFAHVTFAGGTCRQAPPLCNRSVSSSNESIHSATPLQIFGGLYAYGLKFIGSIFEGPVKIHGAKINRDLIFENVEFMDDIEIIDSTIEGDIDLSRDNKLYANLSFDAITTGADVDLSNIFILETPRPHHNRSFSSRFVNSERNANATNESRSLSFEQLNVGQQLRITEAPHDGGRVPEYSIKLRSVRGDGGVELSNISASTLDITRNSIELFEITNSCAETLNFANNEVKYLTVRDVDTTNYFYIANNIIANRLWVQGVDLALCGCNSVDATKHDAQDLPECFTGQIRPHYVANARSFQIKENRIAGNFIFKPSFASWQAAGDRLLPNEKKVLKNTVNLRNNIVGAGFEVSLLVEEPQPTSEESAPESSVHWHGNVVFDGSEVEGGLFVHLHDDDGHELASSALDDLGRCEKATPNNVGDPIHFSFNYMAVDTFRWGFPLESRCYTWTGVDLFFSYWGHPQQVLDTNLESLIEWYEQNSETGSARAGVLHQLADHLKKYGYQPESLKIREEAKASAYELDTDRIDSWLWGWFADQGTPGDDLEADQVKMTISGRPELSSWEGVANLATRAFFWPTGFGTQPLRALGCLLLLVFLPWVVYCLTSWQWRKYWPALRRRRDHTVLMERTEAELLTLHTSEVYFRTAEGTVPGVKDILAGLSKKSDIEQDYLDDPDIPKFLKERIASRSITGAELHHISATPGFLQFDRGRQPQTVMLLRYAIDCTIPVIDLHAYNEYYPISMSLRFLSMAQHSLGWLLLTSVIATLAVV